MNDVRVNEDGIAITRDKYPDTSMRWDELRYIQCFQHDAGTVSIDLGCTTGGFITADSSMPGFPVLLKMFDVYVKMPVGWRDLLHAFTHGNSGGSVLDLYEKPEEISPAAATPDRAGRLARPQFPRASKYNAQWLIDNGMGPNPLWLTEWLSESMELKPGMRVLDLGCGRGASSIFLAREFEAKVWAADVWVKATDNAVRFEEAGVADRVSPVYAEAHALPFAHDYFDAIVSIDAYHYFGTDDLYLGYISRYLRTGGQLGIVVPALDAEMRGEVPAHLRPYWDWEFCSFHTPAWWRRHWEKTRMVKVQTADALTNGAKLWMDWCDACAELGPLGSKEAMAKEAEMLRIDAGETFGFARVVAREND